MHVHGYEQVPRRGLGGFLIAGYTSGGHHLESIQRGDSTDSGASAGDGPGAHPLPVVARRRQQLL